MKKLVFAAIAAMVLVSVSNAFATSKSVNNALVEPTDTVAPADSTVGEQPAPAGNQLVMNDTIVTADTTATAE